ncbi:MAG: Asp-tRNA(Asn)/Glu-tRNA(Gln) amidotransferase subunit GatC [Patescibacteria group bacterium]
MSLSRKEVETLAELARLQLSEQELVNAEKDLDSILGYVDRLKKIDVSGVLPHGIAPIEIGWRPDAVFECDDVTRELILTNFPSRRGDLLETPAVFEEPKK